MPLTGINSACLPAVVSALIAGNEVDQTFINGPNGLEFHASLFVSNPPNTANAQEDKDVFDSTGTQCMSYVPPAGQPGNLRGKLTPYTCPTFDGRYASQFHTYKV